MKETPKPYRKFRIWIEEFDGRKYALEFNWSPKFIRFEREEFVRKEFENYIKDVSSRFFNDLIAERRTPTPITNENNTTP